MGSLRPNTGRADRVCPCWPPVQSLSPEMAPRGAARILPLVFALAAAALVSRAREPRGALWPGQGCAALGRCCPGRDPTCAAPGPPRCFCDQACGAVRDCCADYARACPGEPRSTSSGRSAWSTGARVWGEVEEGRMPPTEGVLGLGVRWQGGMRARRTGGDEWC